MKNLTQHTYFTWSNLLMLISFVGNVSLYVMLLRTEVRKNFHNLLMLLNTFEMVSKKDGPSLESSPNSNVTLRWQYTTSRPWKPGTLGPPPSSLLLLWYMYIYIPMLSRARLFLCSFSSLLLLTPSSSSFLIPNSSGGVVRL